MEELRAIVHAGPPPPDDDATLMQPPVDPDATLRVPAADLDATRVVPAALPAGAAGRTAPAVDRIPKDIVLCDWHYEKQQGGYPSIAFLLDKGFPVWPTGWNKPEATTALLDASLSQKNPHMLGYLSSTWNHVPLDHLAGFQPTLLAAQRLKPSRGQE